MDYRMYGNSPFNVIVLHGGPGAPGCCAAICRGIADEYGVLEHLQKGNSAEELIEEIRSMIKQFELDKVVLIGHSYGAWLAFMFAASHPQYVSKLIMVSSGPFEAKYFPRLIEARSKKEYPPQQIDDMKAANLYSPKMEYKPDHYCLFPNIQLDMIAFNEAQHIALMNEAQDLRASGELLAYANQIRCPVVAIHGKYDPHPYDGVKVPLENKLSDFNMIVIDKCGHDPWKEYYAKEAFFDILKSEVSK